MFECDRRDRFVAATQGPFSTIAKEDAIALPALKQTYAPTRNNFAPGFLFPLPSSPMLETELTRQ